MRWLFVAAALPRWRLVSRSCRGAGDEVGLAPGPRRPESCSGGTAACSGSPPGTPAPVSVIGVYEVCWSLLLHLRGASAWQIGLTWTLFAAPFAAASVPGGWLVDHLTAAIWRARRRSLSAVFAAIYPFLHSVWLLVGLGAAEAMTVAVAGPALASQLAHSVPGRQLGRAQGAASTAQTGGTGLSALVAGALFALHPWVPFLGGRQARSSSPWPSWPFAGGACRAGAARRSGTRRI